MSLLRFLNEIFAKMFLLFILWNFVAIMFLTALAVFHFMSQAAELLFRQIVKALSSLGISVGGTFH